MLVGNWKKKWREEETEGDERPLSSSSKESPLLAKSKANKNRHSEHNSSLPPLSYIYTFPLFTARDLIAAPHGSLSSYYYSRYENAINSLEFVPMVPAPGDRLSSSFLCFFPCFYTRPVCLLALPPLRRL
jgi:hypothetical protein